MIESVESGRAWLEPFAHELAHYAVLVFLDEENELPFVLWVRNGCIWADNRITLLVERCTIGAFERAHHDECGDGRERSAAFWKLKVEPQA